MRHIEADANKTYELSQENGPWMIMATTFRGPTSLEDAKRLVHELRSRYKLPAYMHRKEFDHSDSMVGRGVNKYGQPRRMRNKNSSKVQEVAVLVGKYPSVDDPQAQRDLQKIKTMRPASLEVSEEGQAGTHSYEGLRQLRSKVWAASSQKKSLGPMRLALVTTNPLMPDQYFRPKGVDQFVEKLNAQMRYSLLECPGNYTVKVATFYGVAAVSLEGKAKARSSTNSRLEEGADKANKLTIALRAKGYEAYQFHDRNSSVVSVGSFYRPGIERPSGIEYEPQVVDLIRRFGAKEKAADNLDPRANAANPNLQPESLLKIPFDVVPTLIEVPKRSVSADYARRPASLR